MSCTFVDVSPTSHFSYQNLPFGIFSTKDSPKPHAGVAIGECVLDLVQLSKLGLFANITGFTSPESVFSQTELNEFMGLGRPVWKEVRARLQDFLSNPQNEARQQIQDKSSVCIPMQTVEMHLPAKIGDYTDFYASEEHATNVGVMFRGKENALMPNWKHLPVGYHGRASSVVVSGTDIRRPNGQRRPNKDAPPVFGPSARLDFELEMAFFVGGPQNQMGDPIDMSNAEDLIFGVVLMNDWSARDIQAWEYVPLGPFLGKNFGTSVSPWVVTMDALEPFKVDQPKQDPVPLDYLKNTGGPAAYDIALHVDMKPNGDDEFHSLSVSNLKYMYWSLKQQLVHHAIGGCNMRPGDLCGTGTISGPTEDSYGSLLELSWSGQKELSVGNHTRKFIEDNDTIRLSGFCQGNGFRVGFGECVGTILPAKQL